MTIDERTRHTMYLGLEDKLGTEVADALMQHLPPVGWADVATKHDLDASVALLRSEIGALRTEMRSEVGTLRTEMRSEIGTLRTEMRSEMGMLSAGLRHEIAERSQQNLRWTVGTLLAGNGVVVGAVVAAFLATS